MAENYNQNQTQFSVEEPLLEQPPVIEEQQATPPPPTIWQRVPRWLWVVMVGLGIVIIIFLLAAWLASRQQTPPVAEQPTATIAPELSPFEQRLEAAKKLLREANPTTEEFPFPPIDMELKIDP